MKKTTLLYSMIGMFLISFSSIHSVSAEESSKAKQIEEKFKAADKDQNGQLTLEEAKAGMPRVAKGFSKIDADNKGYVTVDEIKAMSGS
jgi:Ca2+-binding EF-hand superfamily protein